MGAPDFGLQQVVLTQVQFARLATGAESYCEADHVIPGGQGSL